MAEGALSPEVHGDVTVCLPGLHPPSSWLSAHHLTPSRRARVLPCSVVLCYLTKWTSLLGERKTWPPWSICSVSPGTLWGCSPPARPPARRLRRSSNPTGSAGGSGSRLCRRNRAEKGLQGIFTTRWKLGVITQLLEIALRKHSGNTSDQQIAPMTLPCDKDGVFLWPVGLSLSNKELEFHSSVPEWLKKSPLCPVLHLSFPPLSSIWLLGRGRNPLSPTSLPRSQGQCQERAKTTGWNTLQTFPVRFYWPLSSNGTWKGTYVNKYLCEH